MPQHLCVTEAAVGVGGAEEEEEELPEVVRDPGEASVRTVAPVQSAEAQDPAGRPRPACISRRI